MLDNIKMPIKIGRQKLSTKNYRQHKNVRQQKMPTKIIDRKMFISINLPTKIDQRKIIRQKIVLRENCSTKYCSTNLNVPSPFSVEVFAGAKVLIKAVDDVEYKLKGEREGNHSFGATIKKDNRPILGPVL
jgi:hypothetical protein